MRIIGYLQGEAQARAFSDYLLVQGIENDVEAEKDGTWAVWIRAEDELDRAKIELEAFSANPLDPKFKKSAQAASNVKEQKRREQADYEKRLKQRRHLFRPLTGYGFGPVTYILIFLSVLVFIISRFGRDLEAVHFLYFSDLDIREGAALPFLNAIERRVSLAPTLLAGITHGEIWRIFTPMFVHMDVLHIFFNMILLRDLGSMIEGRQNSWLLLVMVLAIAAVSNSAQFFVSGPGFGGMSGVDFGLLGYIWMRGKFDPGSGLMANQTTVTMMLVWFFLCFFRIVPHVANTVHATGLLIGMAWGWLSSLKYR